MNLKYRGVKLNPKEGHMILKKLVEGIQTYSGEGSKKNRPESGLQIVLTRIHFWSGEPWFRLEEGQISFAELNRDYERDVFYKTKHVRVRHR